MKTYKVGLIPIILACIVTIIQTYLGQPILDGTIIMFWSGWIVFMLGDK